MPATGQHIQSAERLTDPRPGLATQDRAEKETLSRYPNHLRSGCEHCREDQRVAVQWGKRVVVVELEPLDEA